MKLINGDMLVEHEQIEDGSVDLILTDLPYGTVKNIGGSNTIQHGMQGKTNWDNSIPPEEVFKVANRILRQNGKLVLFSQQPYANELMSNTVSNLPYSYTIIWKKDHFANSLIAKKAPVSYYEDVLVFSKQHDHEELHPLRLYFKEVLNYIGRTKKVVINSIGQQADHTFRTNSAQFSLCTNQTYKELIDVFGINKMDGFRNHQSLKAEDDKHKKTLASTFNLWEGNKFKSNILEYKKDYNGYHPTQKPILLLEDLIKTFSNENNLVVDLTMGSGSTGVACKNTNRKFIGIELDKDYFEIAQKRIKGVD